MCHCIVYSANCITTIREVNAARDGLILAAGNMSSKKKTIQQKQKHEIPTLPRALQLESRRENRLVLTISGRAIEGIEINSNIWLKRKPQYQPTTTLNDTYIILGGNVPTVWSSYLYPNDPHKSAQSILLIAPTAPILPVHSAFGLGEGALVAATIQ